MFGDFETMMNENEVGCFMRYDLNIGSLPLKKNQASTPSTISPITPNPSNSNRKASANLTSTTSTTPTPSTIHEDHWFYPNATNVTKTNNLIECAELCKENPDCIDGWSYQIATRKCFQYKTANTTFLRFCIELICCLCNHHTRKLS